MYMIISSTSGPHAQHPPVQFLEDFEKLVALHHPNVILDEIDSAPYSAPSEEVDRGNNKN